MGVSPTSMVKPTPLSGQVGVSTSITVLFSLVILLICMCRQYWDSSHYSGCQCCEDVGVCIHDNPDHGWSDIVHDLPPIQHHIQEQKVSYHWL